MEPAKRERIKSEGAEEKSTMLTVQVLWCCQAWNATPQEAAQQIVADLFDLVARGGSVPVHVAESDGTEYELEVTANTRTLWGDRLDSIQVFFDNVRVIPNSNQPGKFCAVCGGQATHVQLSLLDKPIAFYCDNHMFEARRGRNVRR